MVNNKDKFLLVDFRNGDEKAMRKLYTLYYLPLCYFNQKIINYSQEAEDISTESFLKLLQKRKDFESLAEIKSFLFTVSKNACLDFLRKEKRHNKFNQEISLLSPLEELFIDQEMISAKVLQSVYAEIENLPNKCQQVFKSIYIEGSSTSEIAKEMGISVQTVLNQKGKALRKIRLALSYENLFSIAILLKTLSLIALDSKK
ncbi:RNA polymerase sigma factor [Flavobacterium sp. W22_SRS_FP1]|uniref:RNA polymerase sigma factor n=1 Tax=Flavobacterium sp. W22_SRS_FP1 TaxID=3240276 RepID=UPI003F9174FA